VESLLINITHSCMSASFISSALVCLSLHAVNFVVDFVVIFYSSAVRVVVYSISMCSWMDGVSCISVVRLCLEMLQ